jgi:DNA-binding FadR family transcriptional regulator
VAGFVSFLQRTPGFQIAGEVVLAAMELRPRLGRGMRDASEADDSAGYAQADLNFHHELILSSGNSQVIALWLVIKPLFSVMLQVTNAQDTGLTPSFDDHAAILDLLSQGTPAGVVVLITRHRNGSLDRMMRAMSVMERSNNPGANL